MRSHRSRSRSRASPAVLHGVGEEILGASLLEGISHRLANTGRYDLNGRAPLDLIAAHGAHVQLDLTAELVGARELLLPVFVVDGEDEGNRPSVLLPPRAFQYLSATGQKRGFLARQSRGRVASMACFSETNKSRFAPRHCQPGRTPAGAAWRCR